MKRSGRSHAKKHCILTERWVMPRPTKEPNCAYDCHNLPCVVVGPTSPGCASSITHKVITQAIVNTKAVSKGDDLLLPEPAAVAARDQKKRDGWKRQLAVDSQPKAQANGKAARLLDVGVQVGRVYDHPRGNICMSKAVMNLNFLQISRWIFSWSFFRGTINYYILKLLIKYGAHCSCWI